MSKFRFFGDDFWENYRKNFIKTFDVKIEVPTIKLNVPEIKLINFEKNLFSEKLLDEFIKASSFRKDEILKMNYALRNFNVNVTSSSVFTETVNSSHPINHPHKDRNTDEFKRMLDNRIVTPSKELVHDSSKAVFVESISDFVLKIAFHEPVQTHIYFWVIFFTYVSFLVSYDRSTKNLSDDEK